MSQVVEAESKISIVMAKNAKEMPKKTKGRREISREFSEKPRERRENP
jgi:hypothetical protein